MNDKDIEVAKHRLNDVKHKYVDEYYGKTSTHATKYDEGKPAFSNIPRLALLEVTKVMTHGANKYGKFNYSGQIENTRLTDALERHLNQYLVGEDIDESGYNHIAHVAANALMLLDNILTGNIIDNRNKVYNECKKD